MRARMRVERVILICFVSAYFGAYGTALYCSNIKESGKKFTLDVLKDLSDEDFKSCLVYLGKDPLDRDQGKYIWERLSKMHDGVGGIPESYLQQLGWVVQAIPVKDMANLTIGDIDTVAAFGEYHNLTSSQLQALAEQVRDDWGSKEPSDYTFYDLIALKHILCGFNKTAIELIHPDSYKGASNMLATLKDCPKEPLEALAALATSEDAFGDPGTWHSAQVKSVGCVLNGLAKDDIPTIPPEGLESITPDIVPCLEKETIKAMTFTQLLHLTPSAVFAMSDDQRSLLSGDQKKAIEMAYEGNFAMKESSAAYRELVSHLALAANLLPLLLPPNLA